ncbi:hypothetical protein ACU4HD_08470 [Cupriavidus basilensis]
MVALLSFAVLAVFFVPFSIAPTSVPAKIAQDVLLSLVLLTGVTAVSGPPRTVGADRDRQRCGDSSPLGRMVLTTGHDNRAT